MYDVSMLCHRFSNERCGGGGGGGGGERPEHLPLLFCKSVYIGAGLSPNFIFYEVSEKLDFFGGVQ